MNERIYPLVIVVAVSLILSVVLYSALPSKVEDIVYPVEKGIYKGHKYEIRTYIGSLVEEREDIIYTHMAAIYRLYVDGKEYAQDFESSSAAREYLRKTYSTQSPTI